MTPKVPSAGPLLFDDTLAKWNGYTIRSISAAEAQAISIQNHYLHRRSACSRAFGLFDPNGKVAGVVLYGTPSSAPLRSGIAGPEYRHDVIELQRLWVADSVPRNGESFLIGNTVRLAGKPIVVSFADTSMGHRGVVYQATNWLYTGLSAKRTDWTVDGVQKHGQTLADKYTADEMREKFGVAFVLKARPRKHRYIVVSARGSLRQKILSALRYPVLPYPKAPNEQGGTP